MTAPAQYAVPVAQSSIERRAAFISRTYSTLFASIVAFALIEVALFSSGLAQPIAMALSGNWLITMGAFMAVGWFGSKVAMSSMNPAATYGALGLFVVAEAVVFVPLLFIADMVAPGAIQSAAVVTLLGFAGLTAIAWTTRKDFSFLGGLVRWGMLLAIVLVVASVLFGFVLGTIFSVAMVGLAGASILYETSNVLRHYPEDRHAAAALALFSSVAMMFWYVLQLFISRD